MTDLTTLPGGGATPLTMSSREIADLVEARHNDVIATIERLFAKGVLRESRNTPRSYQPPAGGRPTEVYDLTKRDTMVVASGYDDELRARIIDRWIELEATRVAPRSITADDLLANPHQLLALTQGYALQIEDLKRDKSAMQKDVEALDRLAGTEGNFGIRQSAKAVSMPERKFVEFVQHHRWCFRQRGSNQLLGYADKEKAGYLTHKVDTYTKPDGTEAARETVRFKMAGLVKLAQMMGVQLDLREAA